MHALWSCPELDVVWADQEKWGFRGEIDFTCVKELENTWKIHSLHCLESKEQDGGSGVILISHV